MSTCPNPGLLAAQARRGWWSYTSLALFRVLAGAVFVVGLVAAVRGVVLDLYAATQAPGPVPVPVSVRIHKLDRLQILQATSPGSQTVLPFRLQPGTEQPGLQLYVDGVDQNNWIQPGMGPFTLNSVGSTAAEQLVAHGGSAVVGLCLGWGALLVRRLLLSIGRGQPFQRRNAARIAGIAGLIVAASLAAGMLPYLAARLVLDRLGLGGPGSPLYAHLAIPAAPLWLALFLLAFAQAFRRGTELASDAEGLV